MRSTITLLLTAIIVLGCDSGPPERMRETEFLLGTVVTITIQQDDIPRDVFEATFRRTQEIQDLMSSNEEDYAQTEILDVNRAAGDDPVSVSPDTLRVVREGVRFGDLTDGAFDITIAPLIRLWGIGTEHARVPSPEEVKRVLEYVDYTRVHVDETVFLPSAEMEIDVGGIAKGYAADEAAALLRDAGVRNAILDFGGDIVTIGSRPDGSAWRIGIQHPSGQRDRFLGILASSDESVVSSGAYERFFVEDGIRYHHIFDPDTGYPSDSGLSSVTVVGPDAMQTDALSTAIFVLGFDNGLELMRSFPGYDAIIATEDMKLVVTAGIADRFEVRPGDEYELIVADR